MRIFSRPEANPNEKPYELRYPDGEQYVLRVGGQEPQRQFSLAAAIAVANYETVPGNALMVTDPETGTVLWTGEQATR